MIFQFLANAVLIVHVLFVAFVFARRVGAPWGSMMDALAVATPPGLLLGRISNFINAELWGLPTTVPWGVIFPGTSAQDCPGVEGLCARHPSQLYEAGLEGLALGAVLLWLALARGWLRAPWAISGVFLTGYGLARFFVEFFREPDAHIGYEAFGWLTRGQILSAPLIVVGIALLFYAYRKPPVAAQPANGKSK